MKKIIKTLASSQNIVNQFLFDNGIFFAGDDRKKKVLKTYIYIETDSKKKKIVLITLEF